ncbi:FUSC family protein [Paenibacillus thalictri]|uniref:FUSC family protein n=1 Tax=Paenibacillus thalictri TaxID=2527873 RepID=UPI0013EEF5A9|nr:FUSC family protein [Paenibacillus thalictri]
MSKQRTTASADSALLHLLQVIKQAFNVNKSPLPWTKAISAGICSGIPVLLGLLADNLAYGLLAGIGSLTYLYVFNIPYAQRAKKIGFAALGMSLSVGLGTLLAPYPLGSAIMVGVIGMVVTYLFGALKITGPASIFFVLAFTMATGMPVDPALAPLRAGLVLLGGILSWMIGMIGWLHNPFGPETEAVKKVYVELAACMEAAGTRSYEEAKLKLIRQLEITENILLAGRPSRRAPEPYVRLLLLLDRANLIVVQLLEHTETSGETPDVEIGKYARSIGERIGERSRAGFIQEDLPSFRPAENHHADQLLLKVQDAEAALHEPLSRLHQTAHFTKPALSVVLGGSFDKHSIVFLTAVRFGAVLTVAAIAAFSFDFNRSFWVTLSCAAVMSGSTVVSTFHRAVQRSIGTILGILIAFAILSLEPQGYVILIAIVVLTIFTEFAIVYNYGIAALFITPNALLLAESSSLSHDAAFFAAARTVDVLAGCMIGLLGTLLIGRKQASRLLPHLIAKTIRSQQQFLLLLFSAQPAHPAAAKEPPERSKMQTNLANVNMVFTAALGEIVHRRSGPELLRPAVSSIERLGYLLDACWKYGNRPILPAPVHAELLLALEWMAKAAEQRRLIRKTKLPELPSLPAIHTEIACLQLALESTYPPETKA